MRAKTVNEMAYPDSFNMEEFKNIRSFRNKMLYCNQHLQRMTSGSSRIVYKIDDEKVLKLAKNRRGLAQNSVENDSYKNRLVICADVYDCDYDDYWIEMELCSKCKEQDFQRILGVDFKTVCRFIHSLQSEYASKRNSYNAYDVELNDTLLDEDSPTYEWFSDMRDYLFNYTIEICGDLTKINSWGISHKNGVESLVLIDYGLDDNVWSDHYETSAKKRVWK